MKPRQITNQIRTLRFLAGEMSQAELGERIGLLVGVGGDGKRRSESTDDD